jgi:hypothetical protein
MKTRMVTVLVLATWMVGTANALDVNGAIGLSTPDYAAIYGTYMDVGDRELFYSITPGTFCAISNFSVNMLELVWAGWHYQTPVSLTALTPGIWAISCISPGGLQEITLYSTRVLGRAKTDSTHDPVEYDDPMVQQLLDAMPDFR